MSDDLVSNLILSQIKAISSDEPWLLDGEYSQWEKFFETTSFRRRIDLANSHFAVVSTVKRRRFANSIRSRISLLNRSYFSQSPSFPQCISKVKRRRFATSIRSRITLKNNSHFSHFEIFHLRFAVEMRLRFAVANRLRSDVAISQKRLNRWRNDVKTKAMRLRKTNSFFAFVSPSKCDVVSTKQVAFVSPSKCDSVSPSQITSIWRRNARPMWTANWHNLSKIFLIKTRDVRWFFKF